MAEGCVTCANQKKSKLQKIIEGWGNLLFPNPEVEAVAKARAERCSHCSWNLLEVCQKCTCPIPAKVRSMGDACPLGRWEVQEI